MIRYTKDDQKFTVLGKTKLALVILCLGLSWFGAAYGADIEITTVQTAAQNIPQNQSLRVQGTGSVTTNTLDSPAIKGSDTGQGGNTITLENGAVVQTTRPDDGTSDRSHGIQVFGTLEDNTKTGLAGGGALAGGASNIIDVQTGSSISTSGKYAKGIEIKNNNSVNMAGNITTSGDAAHGIFTHKNNEINFTGTITTSGGSSYGFFVYAGYSDITASGTITTSGFRSQGIAMSDYNDLDFSGSINTTGEESYGIYALNNSTLILSGTMNLTGSNSQGVVLRYDNNVAHLSGGISATGNNSYAIGSGASYHTGESNTVHLLNGVSLTGGIHNFDSNDDATSYLTFGYAKDGSNKANLGAVDNTFNFSFNDSITSDSSGRWDGYFAGGTTSLNGAENIFRNIFVGAASFDNAAVPDGHNGAGAAGTANLAAIGGATVTLNVTNAISTNGTVTLGSGSTYNLSGTHTHTGTDFTITGTGKIDLANGGELINNATGGNQSISNFAVSAGTGTLSGNNAIETITTADIDGTLNYNALFDQTFGTTSLSGTLNQNAADDLTLTTFNVANGDTATIGGTGSGRVKLGNSTISGNLNTSVAIVSTGSFTLDADDTYTLSATHTHTGTNFTANGTLNLDGGAFINNASGGTQTMGTLMVNTGKSGSLSGSAPITVSTANIDGTLELSNTLIAAGGISHSGVLAVPAGSSATITGDYTQTGNGRTQLAVSSAANYGRLNVSGTADLSANNTIKIKVLPNDTLNYNDTLRGVLSAGTLVADADAFEVEDTSAMWKFTPTIVGNSIDLTVLRQLTCRDAVNNSSTVSAALAGGGADTLDGVVENGGASTDMQRVLDEMGVLETGEQVAQAVVQTVPVLAAAPQIGFDLAANGATQVVQNRVNGFSGLSAGDPVFEDRFAWVKPFYSRTDQDRRNRIDGYRANTYGLAIGTDVMVYPSWHTGVAISYGRADVKSDSSITRQLLEIETWQGTLYANTKMTDTLTLNLITAWGLNKNDSSRNILFGGINRNALAEYDSQHLVLDAELVKTYPITNKLTLGTTARVNYIYQDVDGYTETGADALNLSVQSMDADSLVASIGGKLAYRISENQKFIVHTDVGYDLLAEESSLISAYAGGGPSFVVRGNGPDEIVWRGGMGYEVTTSWGMEIVASYRAKVREDFMNQSASVNFRFSY